MYLQEGETQGGDYTDTLGPGRMDEGCHKCRCVRSIIVINNNYLVTRMRCSGLQYLVQGSGCSMQCHLCEFTHRGLMFDSRGFKLAGRAGELTQVTQLPIRWLMDDRVPVYIL